MTKDFNGGHRNWQQGWRRIKIFLACLWHGLRSILTDCEVCGVKSVGGRCGKYDARQYFITLTLTLTLPICVLIFVPLRTCGRWDWILGGATEPAGHDLAQRHWIIKFFDRCDVYSKFGEFLGMFRLPKLQFKRRIIIIIKNNFSIGRWPARALIIFPITIGTSQFDDLLGP